MSTAAPKPALVHASNPLRICRSMPPGIDVLVVAGSKDAFCVVLQLCRGSPTSSPDTGSGAQDATAASAPAPLSFVCAVFNGAFGTRQLHVAVTSAPTPAGPQLEQLVARLRPARVVFCGTCVSGQRAGNVRVEPGNVLVASQVLGYAGDASDGEAVLLHTLRDDWRRDALPVGAPLDLAVLWANADTSSGTSSPGSPASPSLSAQLGQLHVGPIATVAEDARVASKDAWKTAVGVDTRGVLGRAAAQLGGIPFDLVVMGVIAATADGDKDDDVHGAAAAAAAAAAARAAAAWLLQFLSELEPLQPLSLDTVVCSGTEPLPGPELLRTAPSSLLSAQHQTVPFQGRDDAVAALCDWVLRDDSIVPPLAIALVHGPGGVGKTRLLIEVCENLRKQKDQIAGFLQMPYAAAAAPLTNAPVARDGRGATVTIVIDDADCCPNQVAALLSLLATASWRRYGKVRVVLLARSAGVWLDACKGASISAVSSLLSQAKVLSLAGLALDQDDLAMQFRIAVDAFGQRLGIVTTHLSPPPLSDTPRYSRILYVHMKALAALLDTRKDTFIDAILEHELLRWQVGELSSVPVDEATRDLKRLLAAVTLRGGCRDRVAAEACGQALNIARLDDAVTALSRAYSSKDAFIAPLEPDMLAEALVYDALVRPSASGSDSQERSHVLQLLPNGHDNPSDSDDSAAHERRRIVQALFGDHDRGALNSAFAVLARISADHAGVEPWSAAVLEADIDGRWLVAFRAVVSMVDAESTDVRWRALDTQLGATLAAVLERQGTLVKAQTIMQVLPRYTVALREVAEWSARKIVAAAAAAATTAAAAATTATSPSGVARASSVHHAHALLELSFRQSELGQYERSLETAREAVAEADDLATTSSDDAASQALRAKCLTNLAGRLSDVGSDNAVENTALQALLIWRELACVGSDHAKEMVECLVLLCAHLVDLRRCDAALHAAFEAVALCERFSHPQYLAACLHRMALAHRGVGKFDRALESAQRAVAIAREIANECPDAFAHTLASALNTLGLTQSSLALHQEAVSSTEEAVELFQRLARRHPDAFNRKLASALNNLGNYYGARGLPERALDFVTKAMTLERAMTLTRPANIRLELAASLTNLAIHFSAVGQYESALASAQEAVQIYSDLARRGPNAYLKELAASLTNLAAIQSKMNQMKEALVSMKQVVQALRHLASQNPDAVLPALVVSLNNLCLCELDLHYSRAALQTAQEATAMSRKLVKKSSDAGPTRAADLRRLATSLDFLGRALLETGQSALSEHAFQEAIGLVEQLVEKNGDASSTDHLRDLRARLDRAAASAYVPSSCAIQ